VRVGSLVELRGSLLSSYEREGEIGVVLSTEIFGSLTDEYSRVLWSEDNELGLCKTKDLKVVE